MKNSKKESAQRSEGYSIQILPWLLVMLILCTALFFIFPSLFNPDNTFSPYAHFPGLNPIGKDLQDILDFSRAWLKDGSPYVGTNYYFPLQAVFFAPLTALTFSRAYKIITFLSLVSYISLFILFLLLKGKRMFHPGWISIISVVGLFSYTFLFLLERGQYDLITMAICAAAIYLFHFKPRLRILSYILFIIAVQLKVYPLIFLLVFIDHSEPLTALVKRWGGILLANLLLLLSLGWNVFLEFMQAFRNQVQYPTYAWIGNHSINSFLTVPWDEADRYSVALIQFVDRYGKGLQALLFAVVIGCIIYLFIRSYRKSVPPCNPCLILGCTLGCMLIPSTSHDYKLSLLGPVIAYLFSSLSEIRLRDKKIAISISLIAGVISLLFSITLFVLYARPFWLQSSFPLLMAMLFLTILLFEVLLRKKDPAEINAV